MPSDSFNLDLPEIEISSESADISSASQAQQASKQASKKPTPIHVTKEQIFKSLQSAQSSNSVITPRRVAIVAVVGLAAFLIYKGIRR